MYNSPVPLYRLLTVELWAAAAGPVMELDLSLLSAPFCTFVLCFFLLIEALCIDCTRGRPNFVFVFGPKNDDFLVFGLLFFRLKSLTYFRFYFIFQPNNPRKLPQNALSWLTKEVLESKHFAAAAATSLHAAWLTVYQQVARGMAIARRRLYSPGYTVSVKL